MFLLERAKALHNTGTTAPIHLNGAGTGGPPNPFVGPPNNPFLGHPGFPAIRSGLFPGPIPTSPLGSMEMGGKDMLQRWRQSLPSMPLPPTIQESPSSPMSPCISPEKRGDGSPERPPSSITSQPPMTNGEELRQTSECGTPSPRQTDSTSPGKSEGGSPGRDTTTLTMSPYGGALNVPSLFPDSASRIPKSDPMEGRLQDMLRYNMEKFAGQPIDTLADSRRVRELLSVHNIGQRLFAKYVLGLSQGTVSELLSKPKSWDKLTEKGRDSYRKMHAWCHDEQAIMLLKTLIPRKGELVRPVSSASMVIKSPHGGHPDRMHGLDDRKDGIVPKNINDLVAKGSDLQRHRMLGETPEDAMSRAYREEFARIMGANNKGFLEAQQQQQQQPASQLLKPSFLGAGGPLGPLANQGLSSPLFPGMENFPRPPGDIQQALTMYQEELSRLQQNAMKEQGERSVLTPSSEDGRGTPGNDCDVKADPIKQEGPGGSNALKMPQKPGFPFPQSPKMEDNSSGSPLQRMASITNALVSQPSQVNFGTPNRPNLKNVLPPITQQQFDRYNHLNTDETVRRCKEILSQYSISQRLFGEAVLGLSQGSVSDLLARPKPWHMLTQKGREPFIRMRIFLDDEGAVHRLEASQYKIAPDKLMRTGINPGMGGMAPTRPLSKMPESLVRPPFDTPMMPSTLRFGTDPNLSQSAPLLDPLAAHRKMLSIRPPGFPPTTGPSLYEMAALTNELDTLAITTKVKEILLAHNVGQKLFGEFVLGLSQGSVSELLSKPKSWHMLSIKGREPFIRMQLWLNDPGNMDKLLSVKNEKR